MSVQLTTSYDNIFIISNNSSDLATLSLIGSINRLSSDPNTSSLLSYINGHTNVPIYITAGPISSTEPSGFYELPLDINRYSNTGIPFINTPSHLIGYRLENSLNDLVDGFSADFHMSSDRGLYHELTHVWQTLSLDSSNPYLEHWDASLADINYREEVSVNIENIFYAGSQLAVDNGDVSLRLGHRAANTPIDPVNSGGVSGTEGFIGSGIISKYMDQTDTNYTFSAIHSDGFISKTYQAPGYNILGQQYDHYITYESNAISIHNGDIHINDTFNDMLKSIMIDDAQNALNTISSVSADSGHIFSESILYDGTGNGFAGWYAESLNLMPGQGFASGPIATSLGIGADRFVDVGMLNGSQILYDISGPIYSSATTPSAVGPLMFVNHPETTTSAPILAMQANQSQSTLMLGASGSHIDGSILVPNDDYLDARNSADLLSGSPLGDMIIMGTGGPSVLNPNIGYGNDGNDILIGRSGIDYLYGGSGQDIIVTGPSADYADGGDGLDILDYHQSTESVTLDLPNKYGSDGDAEGDTWTAIETFMGSSHNDTFYGIDGTFMAGMEGDDIFYMTGGDVASGGEGSDTFYITTGTYHKSVGIIDLDSSDRIFVNGEQVGISSMPFMINTPYTDPVETNDVMADIIFSPTGFYTAPFSHPVANNNVLDLYIAGFSPGDAGISQAYNHINYTNDLFPFHPHDLV